MEDKLKPLTLLTHEEVSYVNFRVDGKSISDSYKLAFSPPELSDVEHLKYIANSTEDKLKGYIISRDCNTRAANKLVLDNAELSDEELRFCIEFLAMSSSSNRGRDAYRAAFNDYTSSDFEIDVKFPHLLKRKNIKDSLTALRKNLEQQMYYSMSEHLRELNEVIELARKMGNLTIMHAAIASKAKVFGYDKKTIDVNIGYSGEVDINLGYDDLVKKLKAEQKAKQINLLESDIIDIEINEN